MTWANPAAVTIPQILTNAATANANKVFLDIAGDKYTFAEIERGSNRLAHGLRSFGIAPGDRVCTLMDTSIDLILLWFAVTKMGAVMVPINTAFRGEFLRHQISDSGARLAVVDTAYADRILSMADQLPELERLTWRGEELNADTHLIVDRFEDLRSADESAILADIGPGDLATLIYTSGTTGPSKGCMLCHNALANSSYPTLLSQNVSADDILWAALPLFHLAAVGVMMACLQLKITFVLAPRFSVSGFWEDIERSGATAMFGLSTMFPLLIEAAETEAEKRCYGQIRSVFGAPFLREMQDRWKGRFGIPHAAAAGYGMTECCPIAVHPEREVPPTATGVPLDYLEVRIMAEDSREAAPDEPGEICVRPKIPHVMFSGYWRRPEATAEALRDMWFHTGDIGKIDAEGNLYFVDRKKDYMRNRGENISSFELEGTFRGHPAVADIAIHSVPSKLVSEDEIKATIILREELSATEEELCRWSIEQLPYFAVPRYIEFRKELPRNAVGRVLKFELRAEGVTAATWDREVAGIKVSR